ncbi:SanA/YdcF family protein [Persicobacter diffluens]|uniref:DUF218 domain-containing protein n=1 Tax=Persicobacter diffluens TaxID=981 RepID=A0AAN5AKS6_9BACT|nr:hypothetical protein PEDI_37120 [Persicobacter diffluens]
MYKALQLIKKIIVVSFFAILLFIAFCEYQVNQKGQACYDDLQAIPANKIGLVLGTAKYHKSGINLYYKSRINATVALYKAGKIQQIIISGDNGSKYYNEPKTFYQDLTKAGIPKEKIFLDFAGFRTLDSVVRCKNVFGQEKVTIISQEFHNERALFLADHFGLEAIAFNASDVPFSYGIKGYFRERLARCKAVLDVYLLNTQPKFLGEPVIIPQTS